MLDKKTIAALNNDFSDIDRDELKDIFDVVDYYIDRPDNGENIKIVDYVQSEKLKKDILNYQKLMGLIQSEIMKKEQEKIETNIHISVPNLSEYVDDEETKSKLEKYEKSKDKVVGDLNQDNMLSEQTKNFLVDEFSKRLHDNYDLVFGKFPLGKTFSPKVEPKMSDYLEIYMLRALESIIESRTNVKSIKVENSDREYRFKPEDDKDIIFMNQMKKKDLLGIELTTEESERLEEIEDQLSSYMLYNSVFELRSDLLDEAAKYTSHTNKTI